jgi:hypothetical protein
MLGDELRFPCCFKIKENCNLSNDTNLKRYLTGLPDWSTDEIGYHGEYASITAN